MSIHLEHFHFYHVSVCFNNKMYQHVCVAQVSTGNHWTDTELSRFSLSLSLSHTHTHTHTCTHT